MSWGSITGAVRHAVTRGRFSPQHLVKSLTTAKGVRSIAADSAQYSGVVPLANAIDRSGRYGRVINAATGLGQIKDANDVLSGRSKWDAAAQARHNSPYASYEDAKYSKKKEAADAEFAAQQAEQNDIDRAIEDLRAEYGLFDGPDSASDPRSAALREMAARRNADLSFRDSAYANAYRAYFQPGVDSAYFQASRNNRFTAAARGTTGGSEDLNQRRLTLSQYLRGSQAVASGAGDAVRNLRTGDQGRRLSLEGRIRGSGDAQSGALDWLGGAGLDLTNARIDLPGETAGSLFGTAGSIYGQNQEALGRGRRGLSLYDDDTTSGITPS